MKTLKITLTAIFSIVLLTGVKSLNDTGLIKEETNKELKKAIVDISAMKEKKGIKTPQQG